jgi:hypothetical protein
VNPVTVVGPLLAPAAALVLTGVHLGFRFPYIRGVGSTDQIEAHASALLDFLDASWSAGARADPSAPAYAQAVRVSGRSERDGRA